MGRRESFRTVVGVDRRGRTVVPIPFDPDLVWGVKPRHPVRGSVAGRFMRGTIDTTANRAVIALGPSWTCDPLTDGSEVEVVLEAEGPQRSDLAADVAAALEANPAAGAAFDGLAQFYRTKWLRWIDATKRRPDQRPVRIADMIDLLHQGFKERP